MICPTTAPPPPCATSSCARTAAPSTKIRSIDGFTPSRSPAQTADRRSRSGIAPEMSLSVRDEALLATAEALRRGQIVAVKGLGGFHLLVDARDDQAVARLRDRKQRYEKPLAVMFRSLESVAAACLVSPSERDVMTSSAAPIVLLRQRNDNEIAPSVAPENPVPRRDAALHAAARPSLNGTRFPGGRHQRQPLRRADLHRRARGAGSLGRRLPTCSSSTTARLPARSTIRSSWSPRIPS